MTRDEQVKICYILAKISMFGHGWVGSTAIDDLQKHLPTDPSWQQVYGDNARQARYDAVGVVKDEKELMYWLSRGYWVTNYNAKDHELALFNPPPMNGLNKYVIGDLADKYAPRVGILQSPVVKWEL